MPQKETGLNDQITSLGEVPKSFVYDLKSGTLRPVDDPQNPQIIDWDTAVDLTAKLLVDSLKSRDRKRSKEVEQALAMANGLGYSFLGGHRFLVAGRRPNLWEWLPAGAQCFVENFDALRAQVPGVSKVVNIGEMVELLEQLSVVQHMLQDQTSSREGYERLMSILENRIYAMLSDAYNLSINNILGDMVLNARMRVYIKLFTQSAEDAKETKKDNEKVFNKAVDAVTQALKNSPAPTTDKPPATPAPALPDLDTIKSMARNRGKDRG